MRLTRPDVSEQPSLLQHRSFGLAVVSFAVVFNLGYGWTVFDEATNGVRTEARVVEVIEDPRRDTLVVEFTTEDGEPVTTELTRYTGDHAAGDRLRVRYLSRDPENVRLAEDSVVEPTFFVVGGLFLAIGLGLSAQSRSSWRISRRPASVIDPDSDG